MKNMLFLCVVLLPFSCQQESFNISTNADDFFFLRNNGADMPVWVKGNTQSKNLILILHGGPGGSAFVIHEFFTEFTEPLEASCGVVYWEQRSSGSSQGNFSAATLTLQSYVDDLEKLVALLKDKYEADTNIFLLGVSWGGYLGSAFLAKDDNQNDIKGWINIAGTNSFSKTANLGKQKLLFYAGQQLGLSANVEEWTEIKEWAINQDTIVTKEEFIKENSYAAQAEILLEDSLNITIEQATTGEQLSFVLTSPFSANAWVSNLQGIRESNLLNLLLATDINVENISIPSIFLGGKFDFIVPEEVLLNQFNAIASDEKEIHFLSQSGHGILGHETIKLNELLSNFIEKHK
jgi:pimeloyl-ACP methyl ester carboxylesterase